MSRFETYKRLEQDLTFAHVQALKTWREEHNYEGEQWEEVYIELMKEWDEHGFDYGDYT